MEVENSQTLSGGHHSDNSVEGLNNIITDFSKPAEQATDSPAPIANNGDASVQAKAPVVTEEQKFFLPPPPEQGEKPAAPIFQLPQENATASTASTADEGETRIKKWSKQEMDENLEMFLNLRNLGQAELLAMLAKSKERERFEMDEDQMNRLAKVYRPVMAKYGGKIPDAVWIIGAEAIITLPLILTALDERKTNTRNAKLAATPGVKATVAMAAVAPSERKNFSIDDEGYYIKDRKGKYLKIGKRTEKASLEDIERIKEDNDINVVMAAFPELANAGS